MNIMYNNLSRDSRKSKICGPEWGQYKFPVNNQQHIEHTKYVIRRSQ